MILSNSGFFARIDFGVDKITDAFSWPAGTSVFVVISFFGVEVVSEEFAVAAVDVVAGAGDGKFLSAVFKLKICFFDNIILFLQFF